MEQNDTATRPATRGRAAAGAGANAVEIVAPRLSWGVTAVVFIGLCLMSFSIVLDQGHGPGPTAAAAVGMAALFALQMAQCRFAGSPAHLNRARAALTAQAVLAYAPIPYFGVAWTSMPIFFAGSAPLVLPPLYGWACFAAVVVGDVLIQASYTSDPTVLGYAADTTAVFSLAVYGLSHLRTVTKRMRTAQERLADAAVARERLRFARDLHDVLGYSLSSIILKAELAHRMVPTRPAQAQQEVEELLTTGRQALADARSVAHGYRDLSLDDECRSAHSILTAAGVDLRLRADYQDPPPRVGTVVATLIREGVTNLLRHSEAGSCTISLMQTPERITAEIVNDGAPGFGAGGAPRLGGSLRDLAHRADSLGGSLTADFLGGDRFRLALELPLPSSGSGAPLIPAEH
ncbi:sensor histidine kinase [Nocardiopsis halophila]|uniref:sensor histidine kinase n=1 Tax=Nocardiopsis halophila TaxID=141692 RepID=UPI000348653C|nr:histidine kinase [Nocardiopsis halophila]